jgi:ankyrin repeat protein
MAHLMEDWRPQNPEDAILSSCSTLITFVEDDHNSKIVQFSHFSVKEFLTSDRFQASEMGTIGPYHVSLDAAHTFLAQACLTVLLQLGETTDNKGLAPSPLASYAAHNWFVHARCKDVASSVPHAMERFFFDVLADHPWHPEATALYYSALCGHCGLANYLISQHRGDVYAKCGVHGTPLHAASWNGHLNAVSLLLDHGVDVNVTNEHGRTPLCEAYYGRHLEVMQLLLDRGAAVDVQYDDFGLIAHDASYVGEAEAMRLLLQNDADVNATTYQNYTPLHWASSMGHVNVAQVLLEHGADINSLSDFGTPLYRASVEGHLEVTRLLLGCGADVHIQAPRGETPFQVATRKGHAQVAQLLLEHSAGKE